MEQQFQRTELLIGAEGVGRLGDASVILFGVGGVGSYAAEGLARAGIGRLTLVDDDQVDPTNLNRQLPALHSTLGRPKAEVMAERVRDINPRCQVEAVACFFLPETADSFDFQGYDYVVDAIDTVAGKIALMEKANREGVPILSSMGTGNKLDPTAFRIAAIEDTRVCPLARVVRKELRDRGIQGIKVLYSEEVPRRGERPEAGAKTAADSQADLRTPGSISFVPSVAGLILAGEVVKDLLQK